MSSVWSLLPAGGRGRVVTIAVVAVIVPLLIMLTLLPRPAQDRVPVAIVNLDVPIQNGSTPVAAGKLLSENLLTSDTGIAWTLTDPATADAGLRTGGFAAVVTIPANFSGDVATLGSAAPTAASLGVTTSTRHGYLSGVLAQALATGLPRAVEAQLTSGYVSGTLSAFAQLGTGIDQAASGATELASGVGAAATGAGQLAAGARELDAGLRSLGGVLRALPDGARGLGVASAAAAANAAALSDSIARSALDAEELSVAQDLGVADLDILAAYIAAHPTTPASELLDDLQALRAGAADVAANLQTQADRLAGDAVDAAALAVGAGGVAALSGPVASGLNQLATAESGASAGAAALAGGLDELSQGLTSASGAAGELAGGLQQAAASIPDYTTTQQQAIATAVASPIQVTTTSVGGPESDLAAAVAVLAPVSLWLGALAIFLIVAPFARAALPTPATAGRIAADGAVVAVVVAAIQAFLVWIGIALLGVTPDRIGVAFGLTVIVAVAFALFHQALTALFSRTGLIISVLVLGLQLVAAGTLGPVTAGTLAATPFSVLPLSLALQGGEALVGGSLHEVLRAAVGLLIWAVLGFGATVLGVRRARARAMRAAVAIA